ncbi:GntR family trehalose operon transcriptional repressor [Paenibacillus shirakamiensis]|uniref:Trehalose operon repressor n=1 Tax=Paenibacillus shirakamiensis TaxID=1265935 RepID=A0ABS4JGI9_9BACL|nr:trehalose operon repressor [Paenibacillus shirakamiensis]MBP2000066.1 GntR family trehalose operon transcriptional repressor [Paenibacillus shirakamiensis]
MTNNIFLTLYKDYKEQIDTGTLKPGSKLPSENELADTYQTTRETVRKGLNLLAQNGYINKVRGKGSFVLDKGRMKFPISGLVSYKELAAQLGKHNRTLVYVTECISAGSDIAKELQITPDHLVWKIVRAREIEGERIILDIDYLLADVVVDMTLAIAADSIYQYLEEHLHLNISYAEKVICVERTTEIDRQYMDLGEDTHVVVVRGYVHLDDTTLFQYTESRHRLDKFQFVDFARRITMPET